MNIAREPGSELVGGRFSIERPAGSGGMGAVYRAIDTTTGGPVAIKILHGHRADSADRFAREARLLDELRHPAIVRFIANGATARGEPFIAMEWLDGETLAARLDRGSVAPREAAELIRNVAAALEIAHARGIVHRDIKPANLFLVGGDVAGVKVLDFGIARLLAPGERLTTTGAMVGTPGYMAPEQARAEREVDARCDVFALGCVLFRCITGRIPWMGPPLAVLLKVLMEPAPRLGLVAPNIPPALDSLVDRMLAKHASERPRDAGVVRAELEAILRGATAPTAGALAPGRTQAPLVPTHGCMLLGRFAANGGQTTVGLPLDAQLERQACVAEVARGHGGGFSSLAEGSFVIHFVSGPTMQAMVASAARCALSLRPIVPEMELAIVAERPGAGTLLGTAVIDEGVELLGRATGAMVVLDAAAAHALGGAMPMTPIEGGYRLLPDATGMSQPPAPSMQSAAPAGPSMPSAAPAAPKRGLPAWAAALLGALALAVCVLVGWIVYAELRGNPPLASPGTSTPGKCAYERCIPLKFADLHRVDSAAILAQARSAAQSVDPNAALAQAMMVFSNSDGTLDLTRNFATVLFAATDKQSYITVNVANYAIQNGADMMIVNRSYMPARLPPFKYTPCLVTDIVAGFPRSTGNVQGQAALGMDAWDVHLGAKHGRYDARTCRALPE